MILLRSKLYYIFRDKVILLNPELLARGWHTVLLTMEDEKIWEDLLIFRLMLSRLRKSLYIPLYRKILDLAPTADFIAIPEFCLAVEHALGGDCTSPLVGQPQTHTSTPGRRRTRVRELGLRACRPWARRESKYDSDREGCWPCRQARIPPGRRTHGPLPL